MAPTARKTRKTNKPRTRKSFKKRSSRINKLSATQKLALRNVDGFKKCNRDEVDKNLKILIEIVKIIPIYNPYGYLEVVYNTIMQPENINKVNSAECVIIYEFYKNLFKKKGVAELKEQTTDDIRKNDILTINVPDLLSYHYIVAVINNDQTKVAIYQSIGESTRLFRIEIDYDTFIHLLKKCEDFIISDYSLIDGLQELEII